MSRITTSASRARSLFVVLGLAACSLQVPKENEVFPKKSATGGSAGDAVGGDSGGGGADDGAGGSTKSKGGSSGKTGTSAGGDGGAATSSSGGTTAGIGGTTGTGGTDAMGGTSSLGGATSTTPNPLSIGLVAHFPFNETSGTIVNNAVDASKNGTYQGGVTHPAGKYGQSAFMRNLTPRDYVELPAGLLSGLSATTISLWFRDYSPTRYTSLFIFGKGAATNQLSFIPYVTKNVGNYQLSGTHDGTSFVSYMSADGTNLANSAWHHVVVTWDATAISLYIDGGAAKSTVATPTALPSDIDATMPTWIGSDGSAELYVEVDDLRIYDRVLTPELIASLFNMI